MVTIESIEDLASFENLQSEWNELLEVSESNCLFLTWEWLYLWWKHLSEGRRLFIIAVRSGRELVAIAPLTVRPRKLSRLVPFPSQTFLGTGNVGSNYLDLIIRCGKEREALQILADYVADRKLMLELANINRTFSQAAELAAELGRRGWTSSNVKTDICPFITLSGLSWRSYLATLGSKRRIEFERRLKNLNKQFATRFEQVHTEDERREVLALLFQLHDMRWRDRGGSEAFCTQGLLSFHEELSQLALERGWLRLYVLRLDGRPVAARYAFKYNRTFYWYQSGLHPAYAKHGVGLVANGLTIKSALEEGVEEFDLLAGDEAYKLRLASDSRELARLDLWPPGVRGSLYKRTLGLTRKARRVARHLLPRELVTRIAAGRLVGGGNGSDAAGIR